MSGEVVGGRFELGPELARDTRPGCCDRAPEMGSHYHCPTCGGECSMMGHWREGHGWGKDRVETEGHYCCPGACGLEDQP